MSGIAAFYPAEPYAVTVHVEELEEAGDVDFRLTRSNTSVRIRDEGSVTMRGGTLEITLAAQDLVCLRSGPVDVAMGTVAGAAGGRDDSGARFERRVFSLRLDDKSPYTAGFYTMDGRRVLSTGGVSANVALPAHSLAGGVYVVRVTTPQRTLSYRVSTSR